MTNPDHDPEPDASNDSDQTDGSKAEADPAATAHPAGEYQAAENRENEPPA